MSGKDFNEHHPELRKREVFLKNIIELREEQELVEIVFESKRVGRRAYDSDGTPLAGYRPVFVSDRGQR